MTETPESLTLMYVSDLRRLIDTHGPLKRLVASEQDPHDVVLEWESGETTTVLVP